jgi:hypothetical protein
MSEKKYRQTIDWTQAGGSSEYEMLKDGPLKNGDFMRQLRENAADVMGPLEVSERWKLLGDANFGDLRRNVDLQGSAREVAFSLVDYAATYGYPASILMLQLVGVDGVEVDGIDTDRVKSAYESLLKV